LLLLQMISRHGRHGITAVFAVSLHGYRGIATFRLGPDPDPVCLPDQLEFLFAFSQSPILHPCTCSLSRSELSVTVCDPSPYQCNHFSLRVHVHFLCEGHYQAVTILCLLHSVVHPPLPSSLARPHTPHHTHIPPASSSPVRRHHN